MFKPSINNRMTDIDRKRRYRQHRIRIQTASSVVDCQPPKMPRIPREQKDLSFLQMMQALFHKRNQRTFTSSPVRVQNKIASKISFGENTGSMTSIWSGDSKSPKGTRKYSYSVPIHIWQRYHDLPFVDSPQLLHKLLRPKVFLDLHTCYGQPLGRVVVQLFTEACPEIVLQFVRVCMNGQHTKFNFTRLFAPMWLEGELHVDDNNALTGTNLEHDPMAINHGSCAGILSFPSRYLRGSKFRFISFTISFKPIEVLNGKRIAFGKIRRGLNVLDNLQNHEVTRSGKPVNGLIVTSCGVL